MLKFSVIRRNSKRFFWLSWTVYLTGFCCPFPLNPTCHVYIVNTTSLFCNRKHNQWIHTKFGSVKMNSRRKQIKYPICCTWKKSFQFLQLACKSEYCCWLPYQIWDLGQQNLASYSLKEILQFLQVTLNLRIFVGKHIIFGKRQLNPLCHRKKEILQSLQIWVEITANLSVVLVSISDLGRKTATSTLLQHGGDPTVSSDHCKSLAYQFWEQRQQI